jgi:hypothetical protein
MNANKLWPQSIERCNIDNYLANMFYGFTV